jgi:site-specific recombinase XerD
MKTAELKGTEIVNISSDRQLLPARKYNTHRYDHRPVSFILEAEVNDLVKVARTMSKQGHLNALMIQLLFQCCLRVSECLQLTKRKRVYVQGKPVLQIQGKGGKPRLVPMPEALSDTFGNYIGDSRLGPDEELFTFT